MRLLLLEVLTLTYEVVAFADVIAAPLVGAVAAVAVLHVFCYRPSLQSFGVKVRLL